MYHGSMPCMYRFPIMPFTNSYFSYSFHSSLWNTEINNIFLHSFLDHEELHEDLMESIAHHLDTLVFKFSEVNR